MRRLEHLSGIERMEVGVVVVQPLGDLKQDSFQSRDVVVRLLEWRQHAKTRVKPFERRGENAEGVLFQVEG